MNQPMKEKHKMKAMKIISFKDLTRIKIIKRNNPKMETISKKGKENCLIMRELAVKQLIQLTQASLEVKIRKVPKNLTLQRPQAKKLF
jgi:hypothetical protein